MSSALAGKTGDLFEYLLRIGDDSLVLGHRLSEWCGHAPILEEDIALANIALDLLGQATAFLRLAGEVEGKGRSEDDLAYFREATQFRNCALLEQPNGDFAKTIVRQFLYDSFAYPCFEFLSTCPEETLAGIARKALKETRYHLRHSGEWMIRLGDGTEESHRRTQAALDDLWMYTAEMFEMDEIHTRLMKDGIAPDLAKIKEQWKSTVEDTVKRATLSLPADGYMAGGSRAGRHTEHLGHMLSEMQILPRSYPDARW